ncbi:60S ribosomal protein L9 [Pyrus ussuriensis x Pyrus communis]|uniref:60S ribosomal protein L9 n=1 Tax=Pyrus ussuriensis x Pyrus communis TaxID=2448454 RepID=A0A5N5G5C8_9ROSA|nr:60S ribosomal protein L9 [Pyrus ussuriensis x Pyrus communis]
MMTILASETMDILDGDKIKVHAKIIEVLTGNLQGCELHVGVSEELAHLLRVILSFLSKSPCVTTRIFGIILGSTRFVYASFSIIASITNEAKSIDTPNFLGEKKEREMDMLGGVSISQSEMVKDEPILDGNDIKLVSWSCALINQKGHLGYQEVP